MLIALLCSASFTFFSCGSNADNNNHTHSDGSTHTDHDSTKPAQQEFSIVDTLQVDTTKKDTGTHAHEKGEKHSH